MTHSTLARIICIPMLLAATASIAAPAKFSENLSDWNHDAAPAAVSGAASSQPPVELETSSNISRSIIHELVLLKGRAMLGTPYVFGSNGIDGVDCSALIQQLFESAGIVLPRTTHDLASIGEPVSSQSLLPGDLLFYRWKKHGLHVAVYAGDGMVIHASPGERSVVITALNETWKHHFVAARRVMT